MRIFNEQIKEIVETEGNILVQSSAGTGKTSTLIAKIEYLFNSGRKNLLILTFSNAGVEEIKRRLERKGYDTSSCLITTIHAFCFAVVKENIALTPYTEDLEVLDGASGQLMRYRIMKEVLDSFAETNNGNAMRSIIHQADSLVRQNKEDFFLGIYEQASATGDLENFLNTAQNRYVNYEPALVYEEAKLIVDILKEFDQRFVAAKINNNSLDFSDMERQTLALLSNKKIADSYRFRYDYILVDEYQDTSTIQETIINSISRNNTFFVGDVKQSIYGFRMANTDLMANRASAYSQSRKGKNLYLTYNYRSCGNIVNFVNDIFTSAGGLFPAESALVCKHPDTGHDEPVVIRHTQEVTGNSKIDNSLAVIQAIQETVGTEIYDPMTNQYRSCKYSDIMVISQKLSTYKRVLCHEFEKAGIPYSISQPGNLFQERVVKTLISILKLFVYHADIDFINFFHQGFMNFSDEDIVRLKNTNGKESFYNNILAGTNNRYTELKTMLSEQDSKREGFFQSLVSILTKTGFFAKIEEWGTAEINREYANAFIFWASEKAQQHPEWELIDFILYIDELNASGIKISNPDVEFAEAVRISTIHSVKGMDAPVVIVAFADEKLTFTAPPISFDKDLGVGIKYYNLEAREKKNTDIKEEIDRKLKEESFNEDMRLLYVALTRAREKLYVVGKEPGAVGKGKTANSFIQYIEERLRDNPNHDAAITIN